MQDCLKATLGLIANPLVLPEQTSGSITRGRAPWRVILLALAATAFGMQSGIAQETSDPADEVAAEVAGESESQAEEAIHDGLRAFRSEIESVVSESKWDELAPFLSSDIVVTWLDGTQSHGTGEVLAYLKSKTEGEDAIVDEFSLTTEVAELSDLYGQSTAVAYGTATSRFVLRGKELTVSGPWSATMIQESGKWKLASLSASVGVFDNPLLTWMRGMLWVAGIGGGVFGLVIGLFLGRRSKAASA